MFFLNFIYLKDLKTWISSCDYTFTLKEIFKLKFIDNEGYYHFKLDNSSKNTEKKLIDNTKYFKEMKLKDLIFEFNKLNPLLHFNICNYYDIYLIDLNREVENHLKNILRNHIEYIENNITVLEDTPVINIYPLVDDIQKIKIKDLTYSKIT